jgi:hypothetical protein
MVVSILAGDELYKQVCVPMHASPRAFIESVLLPQIEEDFGQGARIVRDDDKTFHISVDRVKR